MAPLALLLIAACALTAPIHAASIAGAPSDLQKKIPATFSEDIKEPLKNELTQEKVEQQEQIKEINNELSVKAAEDIPVEVVVENVEPSVKINEVSDDEIKRPQVDLRETGEPQRQEHETQNPEQHSDEQLKVSTIKENIEKAQILLKQSFQDVTSDIQNWFAHNIDQTKIEQNIQHLRETFTNQIQKLNDSIQVLRDPESSKPTEAKDPINNLQKIESRLKFLKDDFNNGLKGISAGVQIVSSLRSVDADAAREEQGTPVEAAAPPASELPAQPAQAATPPQPTPAPANPPQNNFLQAINQAFTSVIQSAGNGLQNIQNMLTPSSSTPPPSAQADEPSSTTGAAPGLGSFFSSLNPNNNNFTFAGFFNQFSNFTSLIPNLGQNINLPPIFNRPGATTAKPAEAAPNSQPAANKPEESKPEAQSEKPADAPVASPTNAQPAAQSAQNGGPIREFLANNPITQGLVNTVQRIQNTFVPPPPERVRDVEKNDNLSSKGGWYGGYGYPNGSGDNNNSDNSGLNVQRAEEIKEPVKEDIKKPEEDKVKPEIIEKTEV